MSWYFDSPLRCEQVGRASDALAVALAELGVAHGDRVALHLQNVPQFVIALIAGWKLGAIVVPVNPMLTQRERAGAAERLGRAGADRARVAGRRPPTSSARDHDLGARLPATTCRRCSPASSARAGAATTCSSWSSARGRRPDERRAGPDDVAILTYTSGTTGPPKGAMNTHGNVVFNSRTFRDWIGPDGDDVVLAIAPLFHITGLIAPHRAGAADAGAAGARLPLRPGGDARA